MVISRLTSSWAKDSVNFSIGTFNLKEIIAFFRTVIVRDPMR